MENVKFTTPAENHTVELKGKITGFDQELIDAEHNKPNGESGLPGEQRANRKAIELLVVSVDGSTEGIVDKVLGMGLNDYKYVISQLNHLSDPKEDQKKTTISAEPTASSSQPDALTDSTLQTPMTA